ncbi:MAG TPA: serine O-acetyltransferase EpsC [Burkholderiaceae bacterium]|nr:serine O-acetyltransferase EpsC [Burkholderiaceae bacterium]
MKDPESVSPPTGSPAWDIEKLVGDLRDQRARWRKAHGRTQGQGGREFPSPAALQRIVESLRGALFPMRLGPPELRIEGEDDYVRETLRQALDDLMVEVRLELGGSRNAKGAAHDALCARAAEIVHGFAARLATIRALLDQDVEAAYTGDPAARHVDEVLLCYPGLRALVNHRLAHLLYQLGVPLVARMIAEIAHSETGIDIHPGATIGPRFFIDHGTGVVIGETAVIGSGVRLYQAVTLGAKSFPVGADGELQKGNARHPIVEDDVVVYAGATILGRVTIGRGSTIGGNVWLTRSVPPGTHVTQAQSRQET